MTTNTNQPEAQDIGKGAEFATELFRQARIAGESNPNAQLLFIDEIDEVSRPKPYVGWAPNGLQLQGHEFHHNCHPLAEDEDLDATIAAIFDELEGPFIVGVTNDSDRLDPPIRR